MSGAIDPEIHSRLSPILDCLEKLRQQGNDEVSVPGVVVTGAQSAGKSSVLEALGGIKLPRGKNITTRVPLVLSLQNQPGAFPHHALIGKKPDISDMKEIEVAYVSDEIQKLTVEIAGNAGGVNEEPIYLRVIRNTGPTLTLIDLPGITHYAPDGSDIHEQTVGLIEKYIQSENMVILVVIPAVDDFANAEALKLAKKYDPNGNRTLGVVTKADYVKPGSDIKAKLRMEQRQVQLQLGFIAVINRSAEEVDKDTPAEIVRAREKDFFSTNAEVVGLEEEYWGLDTLVSRIVSLQVKRVLTFVPSYLKASRERIKELRAGLQKMPKSLTSDSERRDVLHKVMSKIKQELHDRVVTGSVDGLIDTDKSLSLAIVPRVTELYREYKASITETMIPDFFSEEYSAKVATTIKRVDGMGLSNMLSGRVCSPLIKDVFATDLVPLSMSLVTDVRQCMQDVLCELCDKYCSDHPTLLRKMKTSLVEDFMSDLEAKTEEVVEKLCQAELKWPFTQNPIYTHTLQDVKEASRRVREGEASSMETVKIPERFIKAISEDNEDSAHDLQVSICVYADIVSMNICDTIPKIIQSLLVHGATAGFVETMIQRTSTHDLATLLSEGSSSERSRRHFERRLAQYEEGVGILSNASFFVCV